MTDHDHLLILIDPGALTRGEWLAVCLIVALLSTALSFLFGFTPDVLAKGVL